MLGSAPIIGFVPVKDFQRAKSFYQKTLGLRLLANDGFALVFGNAATMIRVVKVADFQPQPFTVLGWRVTDIRRKTAALARRGVVFEKFPGMDEDKLGIWNAPGGAKIAWFKDPDGNLLSLSQHK